MRANPVGWFEIPVSDLERAEKFYQEFFGYEMNRQPEMDGITMSWFSEGDMESYGATGTLILGMPYTPSHQGTLIYFSAPEGSVKKAVDKAKAMGQTILFDVLNIGEHGFIAWIEDTEGNRIGLHSMQE